MRAAAILPIALASIAATSVAARDHGRPRDVKRIDTIIVHTVGGPACVGGKVVFEPVPLRPDDAEAWQKMMRAEPVADAHFVIGRSGHVLPVIPVGQIANHTVGVNETSIGIELVNTGDGKDAFPPAQIDALVTLIKDLRHRFPRITTRKIAGHRDVDQRTCPCGDQVYRRRQDPGGLFPMAHVLDALGHAPSAGTAPSLPILKGPAPKAACPAS